MKVHDDAYYDDKADDEQWKRRKCAEKDTGIVSKISILFWDYIFYLPYFNFPQQTSIVSQEAGENSIVSTNVLFSERNTKHGKGADRWIIINIKQGS